MSMQEAEYKLLSIIIAIKDLSEKLKYGLIQILLLYTTKVKVNSSNHI